MKGLLFWTDWGQHPRIERSNMDGTERKVIVNTKIYWPNSIALDFTTGRVYFADSKLDYIDFVNYDGTGRTQVLASTKLIQHPHALAIFEDMIYYSDRRLQKLQMYPKYPNGTLVEYPSHTFSKALGVVATHPLLQPSVDNPCKDSPCSHVCLLGSGANKFTCKCPLGHILDSIGRTCVVDEKPFLIAIEKNSIFGLEIERANQSKPPALIGMVPMAGLSNAFDADYDADSSDLYYVERPVSGRILSTTLTDSARVYKVGLDGTNKTDFLPTIQPGDVGCVAFDWNGRNLYVGLKLSQTIEVARTQGQVHK